MVPIRNGGAAAHGSAWLGINFGRLARLSLITGYPDATDWLEEQIATKYDGVFIVSNKTGEKRKLVLYYQRNQKIREFKNNTN